jgi:hypothetical protein
LKVISIKGYILQHTSLPGLKASTEVNLWEFFICCLIPTPRWGGGGEGGRKIGSFLQFYKNCNVFTCCLIILSSMIVASYKMPTKIIIIIHCINATENGVSCNGRKVQQ